MDSPAGSPPATPLLSPSAEPWASSKRKYHPIADTFSIYAGWLLAWYIAIAALTELAHLRSLDLFPSFFDDIVTSAPLFLAAFACFLFLLCQNLFKVFRRNIFAGFLLTIIAVGAFVLYYINIR